MNWLLQFIFNWLCVLLLGFSPQNLQDSPQMSDRYRQQKPNDDTLASDGDTGFTGINSKMSPERLPQGIARRAVNKSMRRGVAATRGGICTTVHHNPRMLIDSIPDADYLVITFRWSSSTAGINAFATLYPQTLLGGSNTTVDRYGISVYPSYAPVYMQVNPTSYYTTGFREIYCDITQVRAELTMGSGSGVHTPISYAIAAQWDYINPARGGGEVPNLDVEIVVQPYVGGYPLGVVDGHFAFTGSVAGTPIRLTRRVMADVPQVPGPDLLFTLVTDTYNKRIEIRPAGLQPSAAYIRALPPGSLYSPLPPAPQAFLGTGLYTDPAGDEWMLLASPEGVWKVRDGRTPQLYSIPSVLGSGGLGGTVEFTQFAGVVYMLRGEDLIPWQWTPPETAWVPVSQIDRGDGVTRPIPGIDGAEVISDRLVFVVGRDQVGFSDIYDFVYDPLLSVFRIQGAADSVVRVLPFTNASALVFKTRSIYLLDNLGDLTQITLGDVNRTIGLSARKACVQVGADVFFLSGTGLFRISQVVQSRIATQPIPVSDAIEPFFKTRVHWPAIAGAVAVMHGEYFYLALPIDRSTVNNALLCYNTTTSQWEGHHTFPGGVALNDLTVSDYNGKARLFATDRDNGLVYLMDEGPCDRVLTDSYQISDLLETRGYLLGENGIKHFQSTEAVLETWHPSFSTTLITDGISERTPLIISRQLSPTEYYTHADAPYDPSNAGDDHAKRKRKDYSMATPFQLRSGIAFGLEQISRQPHIARTNGRWATLEITNTQGTCTVAAVEIQARQTDRAPKPEA